MNGHDLKREGIERVDAHARQAFREEARRVVHTICLDREFWTTDRAWSLLSEDTHERRAMGAVVQYAIREGWCVATGEYRQSTRPECHARPIPVYRSLLWRGSDVQLNLMEAA